MPMYPYKCPNCDTTFEVRRKFSDDGNEICPKCEAELTKDNRVITAAAFKLEGSGWFKDGYGTTESSKYSFQD